MADVNQECLGPPKSPKSFQTPKSPKGEGENPTPPPTTITQSFLGPEDNLEECFPGLQCHLRARFLAPHYQLRESFLGSLDDPR